MKTLLYGLLFSLTLALADPAAAQTNLAGTWRGRLQVADKSITIHFVIKAEPGGKYSAVVTSPDEGAIKNAPAKSVTFADNKLTLDVPSLSGGYAGTLRNGVLEGEWSQEGAKLPLSLKPFETPILTKSDLDVLRGEWFGTFSPGDAAKLTMVLHFDTGADGTLRATFDVPEQGVRGWEASNVALDDGYFSVELPKPGARVTGQLKGDQIAGEFQQGGNTLPLTLKKGRYAIYLDLPAEAGKQLAGSWSGTLNNRPVIVRFETDAQGRTSGSFESTSQKRNFPIKEAALAGTKLTFGVTYGAKFSAELAGDTLTGQWVQAGFDKPLPLVLTRGKEAAPVAQEMTAEQAAPYLGM